jgi:hypothetical protein
MDALEVHFGTPGLIGHPHAMVRRSTSVVTRTERLGGLGGLP